MLTASLIILLQISHLVNAPLGVNTENIVVVSPERGENAVVRNVLEKLPCVQRIGAYGGSSMITSQSSMQIISDKEGKDHLIYLTEIDREAMEIYGLEILEDYGPVVGASYVTEEFCSVYEIKEGEREVYYGSGKSEPIAGIVRDFHQTNILNPVNPWKIELKETADIDHPDFLILTDGSSDARQKIADAVAEVISDTSEMDWTVRVSEVGDSFDEQRELLRIVVMFTIIAVIISILGFIGISLFFIRQLRNEIAVRRIMGGSISEVITLLLVKFCAPLLISVVAAVPLAYWIMNKWLQNFSYRISLDVWIFIAVGALSILIAVLSVLWQTVSAVKQNPADSIKTE